ncbi:MAG: hypothetical protein B7Y56_11745 [Gallionellales bacterium 35-53-114]|jgi:Cu/Ag efflux pump CusA|nr:MAG: hypothetical protein B7Y56_11745 [Gallionellales bacterium 35-53-114]OYZ64725.1 MAG: hypothetical protein B7Y04_02855 [Gallionellales bacterium 24-53-125]OZB07736.1 MAG: hypothetical protein B7X61_14160 [Gallionellales bacterium 39-52-133]HQS58558.1 hypothetical protein [Gallionellaceae bacterium]HQS74899.1 hypothetical protein [Gallionellaceae bacterium]
MKIKTIGTDLAKNIFPNHKCQLRIVFLKVIHFIASECKALLTFSVLPFALLGGMLSAPLISLFLLPVLYMVWLERKRTQTN